MTCHYAAEDRGSKIIQLIDARIHAIKNDICAGRMSTTSRIANRMEGCYPSRRAMLAVLRVACRYGIKAAGQMASDVCSAIYFEAEELAEADIADMERELVEGRDDDRIAYAQMDRAMA